jgi:hypothetical protein
MRVTQRGLMLRLYREHGETLNAPSRPMREAERRRAVTRASNKCDLNPGAYARALLADGCRRTLVNLCF